MRRAPGFWQRPQAAPGLAARALTPAAWIWRAVTARRLARAPLLRPAVPVICVGNLTVGGTGKTPLVAALLTRLSLAGRHPHALSCGYGGQLAGPVQVDPNRHDAAAVGDEPLLLAAVAPTWIARRRAEGAEAAQAGSAGAIVMDDGFQNPDVATDLRILVIDGGVGFGNGRVLPAGPLREPVAGGLARTDLVVALGNAADIDALRNAWPALDAQPLLTGRIAPLETGMDWRGLPVVAFAGIGRPQKFFATLRRLGADLRATHAFGDHAPYPPRLLARLQAEARERGAMLVTTEKDAVRLPAQIRQQVRVLPVRVEMDDWAPLDAALDRLFARPRR
ncbi:MAG: tetraacyldisaccharide 4'-kinase [Pseudomonadota bacterium]